MSDVMILSPLNVFSHCIIFCHMLATRYLYLKTFGILHVETILTKSQGD